MKIAKIYTERTNLKIDRPFSYYIKNEIDVKKGTRVNINFNNSNIVGYVEDVINSDLSKEEYETQNGFKLKEIENVIDNYPLLNEEMVELVHYLKETTLSSLIMCYQAILPPSLKPKSSKNKIQEKKQLAIKLINNNFCDINLTDNDKKLIELIKGDEEFVSNLNKFAYSIKKLAKFNKIQIFQKEILRNPLKKEYVKINDFSLTDDQKNVINEINNSSDRIYLLEGVTGSGKTEVYIRLAKQKLEEGKNILILVPEVSLTPLMIQRFKERFDYQIAIFHSKLSVGEKYDEYRRIKEGKVRIVIGARSACFAPLSNIGLIVVDEENSDSYKQDSSPSYNMIDICIHRANYHNCKIILGSATPSIESKTYAIKGIYHQLYLDKRINNQLLPEVKIINMKDEIKNKNYSMFSRILKNKIQETIDNNKQVILLLNRRGYSINFQCSSCGYVFKCESCDIPLHYHLKDNKLKCHYCGKQIAKPEICPICGSKYLRHLGSGSQKLEEEVSKLFKNARIARLDLDSTSKKGSLEKILDGFENGTYNILLGTQIIAKGLDFPNVDLVGVINADSNLYLSDFRSSEKAFQLLTQVVGRCGRGNKKGLAIIQTYSPENKVIQYSANQDYNSFYLNEMKFRKIMQYPPYVLLASFTISGNNKDELYKYANYLKNEINNDKDDTIVLLGPSEPFLSNQYGKYKYRFILKYKDKNNALKLLKYIRDLVNVSKFDVFFDTSPYQNL